MPPIRVVRLPKPINGWIGTVEPKTRGWVLFVAENEQARLFAERDPATGAALPRLT